MDDNKWPSHYVEERSLGFGAYGASVEALDTHSGKKVTIKKPFPNFSAVDKTNKPVFALRAYRELLLLWTFRGHPNILHLIDVFPLLTDKTMVVFCTVTIKMDTDVAAALIDKQISPSMRPFIMYSILCGVQDLKPSNIGISLGPDGNVREVRLLDFGVARKLKFEMSYVVQTTWYRAPEVWLQPGKYTEAIDIWSVGCILAEVTNGKVLMQGGTAFGAQLQTIHQYLGEVSKEFIDTMDPSYRDMMAKFKQIKREPLSHYLTEATEQEIDLLEKIFLWNPGERLTAAQCLDHPYFSNIVNDQKKENGLVFTEHNPDQSFEDWNDKTLEFWTEWIAKQTAVIMKDIWKTQESTANSQFEGSSNTHEA